MKAKKKSGSTKGKSSGKPGGPHAAGVHASLLVGRQ